MTKRASISDSTSPPALSKPPYLSTGLCNCGALRKATRRVSQLYDEALGPHGIKMTQRSILEHIAQAGAPTVSELADAMVMDKSSMARNLKPLEREGWVRLLVNEKDRRSRHIALTSAGQSKLAETFEAWKTAQAGFERAFGRTLSAQLRESLAQVASDDFVQAYQAHLRRD